MDFYKGQQPSKYIKGLYKIENIDVHKEIGTARCQNSLVAESTIVNEPTIIVPIPSGDVYFLSKSSGNIWVLSGGSYSLAHTNTNGAHKGGIYYNGYLYYSTANYLGRFDLSSTWSDTFGTFSNANQYKPFLEHSLDLYIGDGKYIASVDNSGTFTANALDIPRQHSITDLESWGDNIVLGTDKGMIASWDTYSSSFFTPDYLSDLDVRNMLMSNNSNILFAIAGDNNVYYYTGTQLELFKKITDVSMSKNSFCSTHYKGRALFAFGGSVYSIHRELKDLPFAIVKEYECSEGSSATIHSIASDGDDLFVSWESGTTYGVDKTSTNKSTGIIETGTIKGVVDSVRIPYQSLPTGTSIEVYADNDNSGTFTNISTVVDDTDNVEVRTENVVGNKRSTRIKVVLNSSGTDTPIIEDIIIK